MMARYAGCADVDNDADRNRIHPKSGRPGPTPVLGMTLDLAASIAGVSIDEVTVGPGEAAPAYEFNSVEMCVVLDGLSLERRGSRMHEYEAASFAFNTPGEAHAFKTGPGGLRYVAITLPMALVERVGADRLKPVIAGRDPIWIGLALRLQREFNRPDDLSPLAIETLALELLLHAAREHRDDATPPAWLRRLDTFIADAKLESAPGLGKLAAQLGVDPATLARTVRAVHGCTVGDLLRSRRVAAAQRLLLGSDMPLAEIALAVGFCDQSHLTRAFRAASGVTPMAFRRAGR